jgi:hypothetical protein
MVREREVEGIDRRPENAVFELLEKVSAYV